MQKPTAKMQHARKRQEQGYQAERQQLRDTDTFEPVACDCKLDKVVIASSAPTAAIHGIPGFRFLLGYINPYTGTHKAGNHAFRRFRNTYLRNHTSCPDGVRKFWLGWAGSDMGDLYDKIRDNITFRRKKSEECGFGFQLCPSIAPIAPNCAVEAEVESVA